MTRLTFVALRAAAAILAIAAFASGTPAHAIGLVLSGGGLTLAEQGGTFAADNLAGASFGGIPFTSSDLGPELSIPFHIAANVNDEIYGNSNSWIGGGANPYPRPFAGVALDGSYSLQSIAFGRDNLGAFGDRALGLYELQYTTAAGPNAATPDAMWTTIGTLDYQSASGGNFTFPHVRHRYNFTPVNNVTGVRLIVPATGIGGGTAIDEIELYEAAGTVVPPPPSRLITPAAGYAIGVSGVEGPYVPASPALAPDNAALASNGAIPIASSALGVQYGFPFPLHHVAAINDGQYGNTHSWIGADADVSPFAGVVFDGAVMMDRVAWGRDNGDDPGDCCGGRLMDRTLGVYTLQYTRLANPDGSTAVTGDPATGWTTIGSVNYLFNDPGTFASELRHEYTVRENGSPILATAFRIIPPGSGIGPTGTAIDEIEVFAAIPEPSSMLLAACGLGGVWFTRKCR